MQFNNDDSASVSHPFITPLSFNPSIVFRRARLLAGGVILEDIDNFNRLSSMLTSLKSESEQLNIASQGFGNFDDDFTANAVGMGVLGGDTRKTFNVMDHDRANYL
eukprot:6446328-Heterocapsa_arctica.AAC.1